MPISITRVYTRLGDGGETALVGGRRVPKDSPRIVAYGTIDELNAVVGLVRVFNAEGMKTRGPRRKRHEWLDATLRKVQNQLFDVGSELATPPDAAYEGMFRVGEGEVTELERIMDGCQKDLAPLKSFVLPGGGGSRASCTRPGRCADGPSASCSRCHAWSPSPSGRCATSTG